MTGFLLDTNCVSELVRVKRDANVIAWAATIEESELHLSALTLGEIRKGIALLPHGKKRDDLERWLGLELPLRFQKRILPVDGEIAQVWGAITADARRRGRTLPTIDGLIAATAVHHQLTLVTRNSKDFDELGTPILNPWD